MKYLETIDDDYSIIVFDRFTKHLMVYISRK